MPGKTHLISLQGTRMYFGCLLWLQRGSLCQWNAQRKRACMIPLLIRSDCEQVLQVHSRQRWRSLAEGVRGATPSCLLQKRLGSCPLRAILPV